ncbi:MAG: YfhO family protein [Proteobacteria bacterium]|nr:YfhO family protein [Pseudomonadota bacterium]
MLILLAALGLSAIASQRDLPVEPNSSLSKLLSVIFPVGFAIAISAAAFIVVGSLAMIAGLLICSGLVIYHAISSPRFSNPGILAWLLVVVICSDVAAHREHRYLIPAFDKTLDTFSEQSARDYETRGDRYRTLLVPHKVEEIAELANKGMLLGIPNISAYDPLTHARWRNFIRTMIGPNIFDGIVNSSILGWFYGELSPTMLGRLSEDDRILGLTSLRYNYSRQGNTINEFALPRAYAVHRYYKTENEEESLAAIKANIASLNESVVLENANPGYVAGDDSHEFGESDGSVVITRYTPNEIELSVRASKPAIVVLTDAFYPGWAAYVDGKETNIYRANSLFRAVEVPPGNHTVRYHYRPNSFYLGMGITLSTVGFTLFLVFARRRRRHSKPI